MSPHRWSCRKVGVVYVCHTLDRKKKKKLLLLVSTLHLYICLLSHLTESISLDWWQRFSLLQVTVRVHPPASGLPRNICQDPVCWPQHCNQHCPPSSASGQALPAPRAWLHLQVDHRLPVWQQAAREGGETCMNPRPSAPDPPKAGFFLSCSSPCTPTVAPPVTSPSSSWSSRNTTLIGLTGGDESAYRWEIDHLVTWCNQKNSGDSCGLQEEPSPPASVILCGYPVDSVESCRFLGTIIAQALMGAEHQIPHQKSTTEDILPAAAEEVQPAKDNDGALRTSSDGSISYALLRVIGSNLPSLQDLHSSRACRQDCGQPSDPGHRLFDTLPSGRRLQSIRTKTTHHMNSFFPSANP